jgi:UDP-glucose 4-epimerase
MIENYFINKKICITGGAGFIGSAIARRLARIANVKVVDSMTPQYGGNLKNLDSIKHLIDIQIGDVREKKITEKLVKNVDFIFNMAGQTSHMDSMSDPFTDLEINAHAQLAILEAVRRFNPKVKLIFASTRQLYGRPNYLPVDEKHPVRPVDINGINKNAGEQFHLLYHNVYGIKTSVLRLTNTYGPGMRIKDARQTFVGLWIKNVIQNNIFEVWGGNQMRDFNYVEDVVDAFLVAAISKDSEGEIFNLGSSEIINLKDLANKLIEINGYGDFFEMNFPEDRKKIDIGDYYSDFSKITSTLGWKPSTSLNKGLKKSLEFYKNDGESYFD